MARSSSAVKGSSSSSSAGLCRKARAIASRCRMPRENSRTSPSRTRARPVRSSHSDRRFRWIGKSVQPAEEQQILESGELFVDGDAVAQHSDPAAGFLVARSPCRRC